MDLPRGGICGNDRRSPVWPIAFSGGKITFFQGGHLKSSSPQTPLEDMKSIYAVFVGSVIREGFGKIAAITEYRFSQVFCQMASCHSIGGMYHVASAFPLTHNYRTVLA